MGRQWKFCPSYPWTNPATSPHNPAPLSDHSSADAPSSSAACGTSTCQIIPCSWTGRGTAAWVSLSKCTRNLSYSSIPPAALPWVFHPVPHHKFSGIRIDYLHIMIQQSPWSSAPPPRPSPSASPSSRAPPSPSRPRRTGRSGICRPRITLIEPRGRAFRGGRCLMVSKYFEAPSYSPPTRAATPFNPTAWCHS